MMLAISAAAAGLLSSICLSQLNTFPESPAQGLRAAWAGWVLVYVFCRTLRFLKRRQELETSTGSAGQGFTRTRLYALAAAVVVSQTAQVFGVLDFVLPLITAVVYLLNRLSARSSVQYQPVGEKGVDASPNARDTPSQACAFVLLCLASSSSLAWLAHVKLPALVGSSAAFFVSQSALLVYMPHVYSPNRRPETNTLDWSLIESIASAAAKAFTLVLVLAVPGLFTFTPQLLISSLLNAALWFCVVALGTNIPVAPSAIGAFAAGFTQCGLASDQGAAVLAAGSGAVALWQVVSALPVTPHRKYLGVFMLLFLIPLGRVGPRTGEVSFQASGSHPIQQLFAEAQQQFEATKAKQSETVEQATQEYIRRYGRNPPPHFDKWFELAKKSGFVLVDEFDSLMGNLEPFWGVHPQTLQRQMDRAFAQSSDFFCEYAIKDHVVQRPYGQSPPWFTQQILSWLDHEWLEMVPDLRLAINTFDEPSVSVPHDAIAAAMEKARTGAAEAQEMDKDFEKLEQSPRVLSIGKQSTWEAMTMSCPVDSPARQAGCKRPSGLAFIHNTTASKDACQHCDFQFLSGFYAEPDTMHLVQSLFPVWSQAKPSSFSDIVYPSPYYSARSHDYSENEDADWDQKDHKLYWVGSATGGHATRSNWRLLHRQRFGLMTANDSVEPIELLRESSGSWKPYKTQMTEVSDLFSTRIQGVTGQCDGDACAEEKTAFHFGAEEKDSYADAYRHKFLFDLDGNSFSGRFYRLLSSKSVVLKQTVFQEWHDDRLMPWVHYVPISTSFNELPEAVRFLGSDQGDAIARKIADDSREWASKTLRDIDMRLVWLRLLMEYGRILSPDREAQV